ncbi:MAG: polyprenyl synthetase family protein [Parcubacteria group bacterium]
MSKNLFTKDITVFKKLFDQRLQRFFIQKQKGARKISNEYVTLVRYLEKYVLAGGKRLRPFLLCRGRRIAGVKSSVKANQAGLALELFHNFALIHDDIMDGADSRRGQPTLHQQLAEWHQQKKWRGDSQEFGVGMAILGGDMLFTWADELINGLDNKAVSRSYHEMKSELMVGQAEDMFLSKINKIPSRSRIINTAILKSARYSVEKPLLLGAAIAGQEKKFRLFFQTLAEPLGLAFQLRDDVLGVFGQQSKIGKSVNSDIAEGKMTLLIHYALKYDTIPKKLLGRTWGNEKATSQDVTEFKKRLGQSRVVTEVEKEIAGQLDRAAKVIKNTKLIKEAEKESFLSLLEFFAQRNH